MSHPPISTVRALPLSLLVATGLWAMPTTASARGRVALQGDWAPADDRDIAKFCRKHNAVTGQLTINGNWPHTDLAPLRCIERIGGALVIHSAPLLERLDGLDGIKGNDGVVLRTLRVVDNPKLHTVAGLASTGLRTQHLMISGNGALMRIDSLGGLVSNGELRITGNRKLDEIVGPPGHKAGIHLNTLVIGNNPALTSVQGFDRIGQIDELSVTVNASLRSIGGFPDLVRAGAWTVRGNPSLQSWTGGLQLSHVDTLIIEDNDSLKRLPELESLQQVTRLRISDNDLLTSLDGIGGMGAVGGGRAVRPVCDEVVVEANDVLPDGAAEALILRLELPDRPGTTSIRANGGALRPDGGQ